MLAQSVALSSLRSVAGIVSSNTMDLYSLDREEGSRECSECSEFHTDKDSLAYGESR